MKVIESFAIEATEEVRKDPRFEWYVNWLKSLDNPNIEGMHFPEIRDRWNCVGILNNGGIQTLERHVYSKILTLDEVYSRYGKEIYDANGIEQPFQGSREYDRQLLDDFTIHLYEEYGIAVSSNTCHIYLNNRYQNESILKQIAEHKAKIEELRKQLNSK